MAKKSRRKRAAQRQHQPPAQHEQPQESQPQPAPPPQTVQAPPAQRQTIKAPTAKQPILRSTDTSHNLRLELFMIAVFGGGAVAVLLMLSLVDPTPIVAHLLHL